MAPSLKDYNSWVTRPATRDRERPSSTHHGDHSLMIPSRTSSLHSRITQPIPSTLAVKPHQRTPKTLTHAYLVCGVGREPSQWVKAPTPTQGKIGHMKTAIGQFYLPEILGSSPRLEHDNEVARSLYAAMRACFPHDVEICMGRSQPHCVHHSFVLQQDSSHTLYGIALRVWSRADEKRAETIRELRRRTESDYYESSEETYWIPYCLSFLSRYPLYDLLGDYLRGMWIHWNKATNLFHAEEVSRILSFPAPRLNDLVRIDMKDYALCYQFPSSPTGFQNFSMWPLFCCLSVPNIVGVIEAAISATRRIIFVSHYPAMLTVATETIRCCIRVYEWSGLYVPIVHARHVRDLVQEPGPYMLGVTAECRTLFTAPSDALVIDLDRNYVMTSSPPTILAPGQRAKMITRLTNALNGDVAPSGVPPHLRSAYGGGKLVPAGQIIVMRGDVESIESPTWWNQDNVMAVTDHVCEKLSRNSGVKAIFGNSSKKALTTKISVRHLNEIVRERNQYSRDAMEAWQDFITLKSRMDGELSKVTKRNNFLVDELDSWKQQFLKFQAFAEQLTRETQDLKVKIENHKREQRRLTSLIEQHKDDSDRLTSKLSGAEQQRDDALEALVLQQEMAEELERERKRNRKELSALQHTNHTLIRQRDESQRVVVHLRALIDGQTHHMQHIIRSLNKPGINEYVEAGFEDSVDDIPDRPDSVLSNAQSPREAVSRASSNLALRTEARRSASRASMLSAGEKASPEVEQGFFSSLAGAKARSRLSIADVADRHLRDKTDAIADIIRNISDQCAAAVEGLQLAHSAENQDLADETIDPELIHENGKSRPRHQHRHSGSDGDASMHTDVSRLGAPDDDNEQDVADSGHGGSTAGRLTPDVVRAHHRQSVTTDVTLASSIPPPTPDLIEGRSNTSLSGYSESTAAESSHLDRSSRQWQSQQQSQGKQLSKSKDVRIAGEDNTSTSEHDGDEQTQASELLAIHGHDHATGKSFTDLTPNLPSKSARRMISQSRLGTA